MDAYCIHKRNIKLRSPNSLKGNLVRATRRTRQRKARHSRNSRERNDESTMPCQEQGRTSPVRKAGQQHLLFHSTGDTLHLPSQGSGQSDRPRHQTRAAVKVRMCKDLRAKTGQPQKLFDLEGEVRRDTKQGLAHTQLLPDSKLMKMLSGFYTITTLDSVW